MLLYYPDIGLSNLKMMKWETLGKRLISHYLTKGLEDGVWSIKSATRCDAEKMAMMKRREQLSWRNFIKKTEYTFNSSVGSIICSV